MKFHEAIVYAEKGYVVKKSGEESFVSFEEMKNKNFTKEDLFESEWEVSNPSKFILPSWAKLTTGDYCWLMENLESANYPYVSRDVVSGNRLYLTPKDIECLAEIKDIA